jgi:hypothetical protein
MRKEIYYTDLLDTQIIAIYDHMLKEVSHLDYNHDLRKLFFLAWRDFAENKFSYDGATFSMARYGKEMIWEIAAFIHDWRNSMGYVSRKVDEEMFSIMILLNYPLKYIIQRWFLTRLTPLNILRHYIKGTLKKGNPSNLFIL